MTLSRPGWNEFSVRATACRVRALHPMKGGPMEGSEVDPEGDTQDPGLSESPTGAPPTSEDEATDVSGETVPETDDQPAGSPETEDEDIEPEAGGATDTEGTPEASGGSI